MGATGNVSQGSGFGYAEGGVVAPKGFFASGVHCGLKPDGRPDLALVAAAQPVPAAGVFTRNAVAAAPVIVSRERVSRGRARAVVINAGNANACTGPRGVEDARAMAAAVADALGCDEGEVLVASTGVIGVPMPLELVVSGIAEAVGELDSDDGTHAAQAIMTTDTFAKQTALVVDVDGETYAVGGMAKGSGMIQPDMATMLACVTTDAPLTSEACAEALTRAAARTFNRITVDSDTSTNDCVFLLASGAAGSDPIPPSSPAFGRIAEAIEAVCAELARMIARDGEGATTLVTVSVRGAASEADAERVAFSIANSPLVKTAIFGQDANWGRVAMAIGKSGALVDPDAFDIAFAGVDVCRAGTAVPFDEAQAAAALAEDEVSIDVDLNVGEGAATVLTCDLSYEYVRINGEYRS